MSIYQKNGHLLSGAYNVDGEEALSAYNLVGETVFSQSQKTFSVLGDSYSAYIGDVYPAGNAIWYNGTNNGVTNKDMMWYRLFENESGISLMHNASRSGSPICYDGWNDGTDDAKEYSFYTRANDVGDCDYIFVFGATNDSWIGVSLGEYKYAEWTESDMSSFRPAFARLLDTLKINHQDSVVFFVKNTGLTSAISSSIDVICEHYSIPVITLSDISKNEGHPTNTGMIQISEQLFEYFETWVDANGNTVS